MWELSHCHLELSDQERKSARQALDQLLARQDLGFLKLHERDALWQQAAARAEEIAAQADDLVVLGIGGSNLGLKVFAEAFRFKNTKKRIHFIDNVDSYWFHQQLEELLQKPRVHWLLVSKSGNTVETIFQANFIHERLAERGDSMFKSTTVVSEMIENPLSNWAKQNAIVHLELPRDVGGRFSVFTPVGTVGAHFLGCSLEEFREGLKAAFQNRQLLETLIGLSLKSFNNEKWLTVFWSYSNQLREFGKWTEQLWAESLAKRGTRAGGRAPRVSTPLPYVGAIDQHSVLQQIAEGARDKWIYFFRVGSAEAPGPRLKQDQFRHAIDFSGKSMGELIKAQVEATVDALHEQGVQSAGLKVEKIDERSLACLMMTMMIVVGALGEALDINAFDQPGVEAGKVKTRNALT